MAANPFSPTYDPFDPWATRAGVTVRARFYRGELPGKLGAVAMGLADWWLPTLFRLAAGCKPRRYAIAIAQQTLAAGLGTDKGGERDALFGEALAHLEGMVAEGGLPDGAAGWGHGFPWMSKNGFYPPDTPLVTLTPYVMEALLAIAETPAFRDRAMELFHRTWGFLQALRTKADTGAGLALSYAPVDEPRIVVNANAYAAFAHALHAAHGEPAHREAAVERAKRLVSWVVAQQEQDGSWRYYADDLPGNFIDGFHSCFVLKNLRKTCDLLPELRSEVEDALPRGWAFMRGRFFDAESGLCRRFIARDIKDPFRWDLYDQAEYLGLLVDFRELDDAMALREKARRRFRRGDDWYCRIDFLGRRWGRGYRRWGIAPFHLHSARLDAALAGKR